MMQETYCHISDRLDSSAPLGRDSVPEVYINRSGSSSATLTEGTSAALSNQVPVGVQPSGQSPGRDSVPVSATRRPMSVPLASMAASAGVLRPGATTNVGAG